MHLISRRCHSRHCTRVNVFVSKRIQYRAVSIIYNLSKLKCFSTFAIAETSAIEMNGPGSSLYIAMGRMQLVHGDISIFRMCE